MKKSRICSKYSILGGTSIIDYDSGEACTGGVQHGQRSGNSRAGGAGDGLHAK